MCLLSRIIESYLSKSCMIEILRKQKPILQSQFLSAIKKSRKFRKNPRSKVEPMTNHKKSPDLTHFTAKVKFRAEIFFAQIEIFEFEAKSQKINSAQSEGRQWLRQKQKVTPCSGILQSGLKEIFPLATRLRKGLRRF